MSFLRDVGGAVELAVHVQPRASRSKIVGEHGDRLKIAIAAPPVDGAANEALVEFLSEVFDVRRAAVTLIDGATGRQKRFRVEGVTLEQARAAVGL